MNKFFNILMLVFFVSGCVTFPNNPPEEKVFVQDNGIKAEEEPVDFSPLPEGDLKANDKDKDSSVIEKGIIFAKTEFFGVLDAVYVKLFVEDRNGPGHKFQIHVGDNKLGQQEFEGDIEIVKPGYFFLELPAGQYKIFSISIPVGSTTAVEDINITFDVAPDSVTYIGTLSIVGTKEKIKLGGVPVIKPGFEYSVKIIDERSESMAFFYQKYQQEQKAILIKLMEIGGE